MFLNGGGSHPVADIVGAVRFSSASLPQLRHVPLGSLSRDVNVSHKPSPVGVREREGGREGNKSCFVVFFSQARGVI